LVANNEMYNEINDGYCLLVGVSKTSTEEDARVLARKIANARIFEDQEGKINLSIKEAGGEILSVSQFTLYASTLEAIVQVSQKQLPVKMQEHFTRSSMKRCANTTLL